LNPALSNATVVEVLKTVRRHLAFVFHKGEGFLRRVAKLVFTSPLEKVYAAWLEAEGDLRLRLNCDITERSLVFDLGGYKGQWASDIFARYCCEIHVFEPVPAFANTIRWRFERNKRIHVHQFGLAPKDAEVDFAVNADGTGMFARERNSIRVRLVRFDDFLEQNKINTIDLMKINIEGGEYDLLEHILISGLAPRIRNIQVQFHEFVPDAEQRMRAIQAKLSQTHFLTYQYKFIWENWRRADDAEVTK